ncbi:MAG TPA: lipid-binding SYLF domain-containing protein [Steroidobacteraceae bacterium]|nr:lipid-binding SYLF domain-containing protein [Steroidobacteraceae bacterium]
MHRQFRLLILLPLMLFGLAGTALAQGREEARLLQAGQVLKELQATPDQFVPDRLLERAYGIAIIPDVTKVAFWFGGRRGNGVLVTRDKDGRFSNPIFVNLTGGSFGFQWGVQSTDIVLVFTTRRSIDRIASGKITLGADASVGAGPVGRQASAATDPTFSSEVYSYSRNRGLFVGVALDGSAITIDDKANSHFYDRGTVNAADIINGTLTTNSEVAQRFLAQINTSTGNGTGTAATASASSAAPAASGTAPAPTEPAPASPAAKTFPMEDPKPGAEPPAH